MNSLHKRPTFMLLLLWLCCLGLCATTVWMALQQPWLGIQFSTDANAVRVRATSLANIPPGAKIRRLETPNGPSLDLRAADLPEGSEAFSSYASMNQFFVRQGVLYTILSSGVVNIIWRDKEGLEHTAPIIPSSRPPGSLPGVFWFQLLIASLSFLIGCWILLLRPSDLSSRLFAATSLMLLIADITAALYSVRELALSAAWERSLQATNMLAVYLFGCALIALFLCYPKQLIRPRHLLWLPAIYVPWYLADLLQWLPGPEWGLQMPMFSQFLLIIAAAALQWRRTLGQPLERTALRWLMLSVLLCCLMFVLTYVLPPLLGQATLLPLGYSFGFFLIMYIGIALGLGRYRLFDMDIWAYRVLLWVSGATTVIVLDALLILTGLTQALSLGVSLLLAGGLYFPLRQWLWQRLVNKSTPKLESLLPEVFAVALAPPDEQPVLWERLLRHIFNPLEFCATDEAGSGIREEGLAMLIPGCGSLPATLLRSAGLGTRLFSTRDAAFAASLSDALAQMTSRRHSYEEGAMHERERIYRDLHDDMGAKLLGLAISADRANLPKEADLARSALQDLRDVVSRSSQNTTPLSDLLADWRMEVEQRIRAAGLVVDWRFPSEETGFLVGPVSALHLSRILREAVSNALRHAQASRIEVDNQITDGRFVLRIKDNGTGFISSQSKKHRGMSGMQMRADALGASLQWQAVEPHGCRVVLRVPLAALTP